MHNKHLEWADLEAEGIDREKIALEIDQELAQEYEEDTEKEQVVDTTSKEENNSSVFSSADIEMQQQPIVQVYEPLSYQDAQTIALQLKIGQVAIIDLKNTKEHIAARLIDFLTGLVYGIDGDIMHLREKQYICTPKGIPLTEEFLSRFRGQ